MLDVFISYKRDDETGDTDSKFVPILEELLKAQKLNVYWDKHLEAGDKWREGIEKHLGDSLLLVLVTSKRSLKSPYVTYEWRSASANGSEFYWFEIEPCTNEDGMYGTLVTSLGYQKPTPCYKKNPTAEDLNGIVEAIARKIPNARQIRLQGNTLIDPHHKNEVHRQNSARKLKELGSNTSPAVRKLARDYLHTGLNVSQTATHTLQIPIIEALEQLGDLSTIPYLQDFRSEPRGSNEADNRAEALLQRLVQNNIRLKSLEKR